MADALAHAGEGPPLQSAQALLDFAAAAKAGALPSQGQEAISEELNGIIRRVAETGVASGYPWDALRLLLARKVELVLAEFWRDVPDYPLAREGDSFTTVAVEPLTQSLLEPRREGPPFTVQRICELLANPRQTYKSTRRFLYALQRVVLVAMTEDVLAPAAPPQLPPPADAATPELAQPPQAAVPQLAVAPEVLPDAKGADPEDIADVAPEDPAPEGAAVAGKKRKLPEEAANGVVADG